MRVKELQSMKRISDNTFMKFAAVILAAVLIVSCVMCLRSCGKEIVWTTYVVHEGDTLWSIARRCSEEGEDTRKALKLIRDENGIRGDRIDVGQMLIVPEAEGSELDD